MDMLQYKFQVILSLLIREIQVYLVCAIELYLIIQEMQSIIFFSRNVKDI